MSALGTSSSSSAPPSNPFDCSYGSEPDEPKAADIRNIHLSDHVPIILSHASANYYAWKTYFNLLFREYNLRDHVDGLANFFAGAHDANWLAIDATLIRWFFLTVSPDIFHTVVRDGDDAYTQEFFGCHQNDSTIDAFCLRLKTLSDELNDVGFKVGNELLLSTLTAGLNEDFSNAASNLTLMANPTYERAVAYLRLEERRMKHLRTRAVHTALAAGFSTGASTPPSAPRPPAVPHPTPLPQPPQPLCTGGNGGNRRRGRGGQRQGGGKGGGSGGQAPQQQPPPPWVGGYNPWTGVVHAYSMPVPRPPAPGILGPRPSAHQALLAAPAGAYGAYGAPPIAPPFGAPDAYGAPYYDPALLAALQQPPPYSGGGGDWIMDSGATSHMSAHPGTGGAAFLSRGGFSSAPPPAAGLGCSGHPARGALLRIGAIRGSLLRFGVFVAWSRVDVAYVAPLLCHACWAAC
nr:uncharacterized protein LOC109755617 [Aegilops tauschii subsp. strangulata]